MESLHDLIYSQQSEIAEESPAQPPKRKRAKRERAPRDAEAITHPSAAAATETVNEYDQHQPPSKPDAVKPDVIVSNGIERRRKRKRGRPSKRRKAQEDDEVWETQSEAERRIGRTTRKWEYRNIRNRWKERVHTLEDEVDYGNSVQHMARKVMKHKKQQQKQGRHDQNEDDDRKPAAVSSPQQEAEMNSSDEEQQEALGSLWTSMTQEDDDPNDTQDSDWEEKPDPNDHRNWDYYQLGYDAPRNADLQDFHYNRASRDLGTDAFQINLTARTKRSKEMEPVTWTPVRNNPLRNTAEERYYLETDMPSTCHTHSNFHHISSLRAMAARFLVGSAGKDIDLENRLLRDLYSAPTRMVGREYHVLTQAMEHGCEFVLFRSHKWKQRAVAARTLGMTEEFRHTGSKRLIGYTMERRVHTESEGPNFRKRIVNLLSHEEIPSEPGVKTDMKNEDDEAKMDIDETGDDAIVDSTQDGGPPEEETSEVDMTPATPVKLEDEEEVDADTFEENHNDPDSTSFRSYLGNDVDYVHRPDTQPPVPNFPLDETGVVLGGEDRYSHVHHNGKIDDATFILTMSVLLARLGKAQLENNLHIIETIQEQIMTFADETAQDNVVQQEKFHFRRRKRASLPSALYYKTMMGLCSFVANSGCLHDSTDSHESMDLLSSMRKAALGQNWMDNDSDGDESSYRLKTTPVDMKAVAEQIYDHCAECPSSTMLKIFPRIHITVGLALIAKHLPPAAAELLSRPFDELSFRTPFDIMRKTLEYLERNKLLVDSYTTSSDGQSISAGYLEHVMNQVSDIFRRAAEADPTDILCHAWYLSSLGVSLLLCSGNAIDGKAYLCPSSKKQEDDYDLIFSQPEESTQSRHEVRQMMSKFSDVRKSVAVNVKKLIQMAHNDDSSIGNLLASSALEWKQMVALLVGPSSEGVEASACANVRRLHSYFIVQWAIKEKSSNTLHLVENMARDEYASTDNVLELLASSVENDPSEILAWRRLVRTLGPAGAEVTSRQHKECRKRTCRDCNRLQKGLNIEHTVLAERKGKAGWWGKGRDTWWHKHVLAVDGQSAEDALANEVFQVSVFIEKKLKSESATTVSSNVNREEGVASSISGGVDFACDEQLTWLNDTALSNREYDSGYDNDGDEAVDVLLPKPLEEVIRRETEADGSPRSIVFGATEGDSRLELLCYKIIVTYHLYGVSHSNISDGVWQLAQKCSKNSTGGDELRCLAWLSSMGLNVPQILHDLYTQAQRKCRGISPYPAEEKEAIRLGMEIFGKEWAKIRDYFKVFEGTSRAHLKHVYTSMKKYGEL